MHTKAIAIETIRKLSETASRDYIIENIIIAADIEIDIKELDMVKKFHMKK